GLFLTTAAQVRPWWAPMWGLDVRTGLRPGELYALEEGDFDLDARTVRVERALSDDGKRIESTPKGNRARKVDLSTEAVAMVRKHMVDRKAYKLRFGWPEMPAPFFCTKAGNYALPCNVRRDFEAVLAAAGLAAFTPHGLRHTFASLYLTTAEHPDL